MMFRPVLRLLPALLLLCASRTGRAGASLLVDDADTTANGHCQLESWLRLAPSGPTNATAVPACAFGGVEYSVGASASLGGPALSGPVLGLKHTLREIGDDHVGLAASWSTGWDRRATRPQASTFNLIASVPWSTTAVVHLNAGWNVAAGQRPAPSAGIGLERTLSSSWIVLAESYVQRGFGASWQVGARRLFGPATSLDLIAGKDARGRWITFGFNYSPGG